MSIPLYMDQHVPKAITSGLRLRGIDVLTAHEDGRPQASDPDLLDRATELQRVLFTQDDDFAAETAHRLRQGIPFYGVVYCKQHRLTLGRIIDNLEMIALVYEPDDVINTLIFLPL